jgi:glycosyltransferase involved in cell wall biosynthesis
MGIEDSKIRDLYYAPAAVESSPPSRSIKVMARGRIVFLVVGTLSRRKGTDVLLRAAETLDPKRACVVFCGGDLSAGRFRGLAAQLGVLDRVHFMGPQPNAELPAIYAASHVAVLASRFDGWGAVLNEAASAGLALIATNQCGAGLHLVQTGLTGVLVEAGCVKSLSEAMNLYVDDPGLASVHGAAAQDLYQREFSPAQNAARLVAGLSAWFDR